MLALLLASTLAHATTGAEVAAHLQSWRAYRGIDTVPEIPAKAYQAALDGEVAKGIEVVEDIKAAKGYGIAVFDIPIAQMWKAVTDEDHHAGKLPIQVSKTIRGTPRTHDHVLFQWMDIPILDDRWWMVQINYTSSLYSDSGGQLWELTWQDRNKDAALRARLPPDRMEDSMPVAWTKGAWLLMQLDDGRTLVEYHTWSDPGGSVPVAMATRFAANEVVNTLKGMAKFARTHIPTCPGQFHRPDGVGM